MHILSMYETREKLRKLDEYLQCDPEGLLVAFGRVLADRLHDLLNPAGFAQTCIQALGDLPLGKNRETQQQIYSSLVGQSHMLYQAIREEIPTIADAVLPPDFAADVRIALDEMHERG